MELIHSVASESALRQLEQHAEAETEILIEVNVAGEEGKEGVAPEELPHYLEIAPVKVTGLMTMPPFAEDPEDSRRHFARLARAGGRARAHHALHGHVAGLRGRRSGGCDDRADRHNALRLD